MRMLGWFCYIKPELPQHAEGTCLSPEHCHCSLPMFASVPRFKWRHQGNKARYSELRDLTTSASHWYLRHHWRRLLWYSLVQDDASVRGPLELTGGPSVLSHDVCSAS